MSATTLRTTAQIFVGVAIVLAVFVVMPAVGGHIGEWLVNRG